MAIRHDQNTPRPDLSRAISDYDLTEQGFIADQVMPSIGVQLQSHKLPVRKVTEEMRRADTRRAPGSTYGRQDLHTGDVQYHCEGHGQEIPLPVEDRKNYEDQFDAEEEAAATGRNILLSQREREVKDTVFNTDVFTGDLYDDNSGADDTWSDPTNDPISQVNAASRAVRSRTGMYGDTLVINDTNLSHLTSNEDVINRFSGAVMVTREVLLNNLSQVFDHIRRIIVATPVENTAAEGDAASMGDIWPDTYVSVGRFQRTRRRREPGFGRIIRWNKMQSSEEFIVESYWEKQTKSDVFQVDGYWDTAMFDEHYAHLIKV